MGAGDAGLIAGAVFFASTFAYRAFVFQDGAMRDLGTLGGGGSSAQGVNNHGTVVGSAQDDNGVFVPFIYDSLGGMRRLFDAPVVYGAYASSINDKGAVVGDIDFNSFLYEDGVLTFLEDLPAVRAAGWMRLFAMKINDRGWIAGWGWHPDRSSEGQAFLLMRD